MAPRRVERVGELTRLAHRRGFATRLLSEAGVRPGPCGARSDRQRRRQGEVVLVDTIGELARISSVGDVVFVGGSLVPFGGHNVIEPASLGRAVIIGPHYQNFRQVVGAFLARDGVVVARDSADLSAKLLELKRKPQWAHGLGQRATETVSANAGASERTIEVLRPFFRALADPDAAPTPTLTLRKQ